MGEAVVVMETPVHIVGLAACVALLLASCSSTTEPTSSSPATTTTATATSAAKPAALKTIDPKAFQAVVEAAAEKLKVPGAMVLLRTPQGNFDVGGRHHRARREDAAGRGHAFPDRLEHQDHDRGTDRAARPGRQAEVQRSGVGVRAGCAERREHHRRRAFEDAQRPVRLHGRSRRSRPPWMPTRARCGHRRRYWTIAFRHPPQFAPDTSYEYSNTNYALLGLIAEKVGGRPLAQQFGDRLFGPVGLRQTSLPAADDTTIPAPFSHGYMYGGSYFALADDPYPADMQAAAKAGTLKPIDYTNQNSSYATAAGGAISTADDLATWMKALVSGKVFDADYQQQWLTSLQAEDPAAPDGQKYGYGISYQRFGPNAAMYYHGGELPGFNSFMGYDPDNDVTLVIWTNLTLSPDGKTTAQAMLAPVLDEIYAGLNLVPPATPTTTK